MIRFSLLALLAVGCASVSTQPEPRVAERVVYVEAPPAPVIVEEHGHRASGGDVTSRYDGRGHDGSKHADSRHDAKSKRHGKSKRDAKAKPRKMPQHRAKGMPPGHGGGKHPSKWAKGERCDEKANEKARENCRKKTARRKTASPTFGL